MKKHIQVTGFVLIALQSMMLVMAFAEAEYFPVFLQQIGHLHPLLIHLPIAFILLLLPLIFLIDASKEEQKNLMQLFLHYNAMFATIAAILGLMAASSNDYDPSTIFNHKWLSISTAILSHVLIYMYRFFHSNKRIWNSSVVFTCLSMMIGSHFGGSLTHGEGYLSFDDTPKFNTEFKPLTDSTMVYKDVINTVIINKCIECHNDKKSKGGLNLSSYASFQKGGKNGATWVSGNPDKSLFIQRMLLNMEDEKHMPPKGKSQLSEEEKFLFKEWVVRKADAALKFHTLDIKDTLRYIIEKIVTKSPVKKQAKSYSFENASESSIKALNSPFRRILPIDVNSPALVVKFYLKEKFEIKLLEECSPLSKQIIEFNLSTMPVDDKVFGILSKYENLERLNLNGTNIKGENLGLLSANKKLEQISLANTDVDNTAAEKLGDIKSLKAVYVWNSKITAEEVKQLQKKYPSIKWDIGYIPDDKELLKLTPPSPVNIDKMILEPGEKITLKHPLPGAQIKYTIDGSKPDSINGILYTKPFSITGLTSLNAVGASAGWLTSEPSSYMYFLKGNKIDSAVFINQPSDKYKAKGSITLIDLNKGTPGNLNLNWIGFRENSLKTGFYFSEGKKISKIILSMADNTGSYVFPPEKIIIKAGVDKNHLKSVGTLLPAQPLQQRSASLIPYTIDIKPGAYPYIEIEAVNVQSLPKWHPGKKEKGWVFADEVFFY